MNGKCLSCHCRTQSTFQSILQSTHRNRSHDGATYRKPFPPTLCQYHCRPFRRCALGWRAFACRFGQLCPTFSAHGDCADQWGDRGPANEPSKARKPKRPKCSSTAFSAMEADYLWLAANLDTRCYWRVSHGGWYGADRRGGVNHLHLANYVYCDQPVAVSSQDSASRAVRCAYCIFRSGGFAFAGNRN